MNQRYPEEFLWGEATGCCECEAKSHDPKLIVLTGGPSAGKTAILEMVIKTFCPHVTIVPEAASIVFGGGFFRRETIPARKGAQRAIFKVQMELERIILEEKKAAVAICERGRLDGLAYWPGEEDEFWKDVQSSKSNELDRYESVIHMRTPDNVQGYNQNNPVRIESAQEAMVIDKKLLDVWKDHPKRHVIESQDDFLGKALETLKVIQSYLPDCCRQRKINLGKGS